jgi:hypothetical protein
MDFIERIFGVSPDGGDGSFELMLLLIPIAAFLAVVYWRGRRAEERATLNRQGEEFHPDRNHTISPKDQYAQH